MRQITSILFLLIGAVPILNAQEVKVEVSYDTVYAGNVVGIRYSVNNWQGELSNPEFGELDIVGGPQITSSMSYSGGRRSSSKTITYFLKPPARSGEYTIPEQTFRGEDKEVTTDNISITVLNNPDGIVQKPVIETKRPRTFNKQYKRSEPERGQRQRF